MMSKDESKIIGISGKTGAGKTTLAHALASVLNASMVCWDDFDDISQSPDDYIDWYKRGENYSEWNYPALADTLQALKSKKPIIHPVLKTILYPTDYIIFDAPLGRLHKQTGKYIDLCVHVEVPLDVSLCRRLLRDFSVPDKTKDELLKEIEFYLSDSRILFFDDDLKRDADLMLDGMLSTELQVQAVKQYLSKKTI